MNELQFMTILSVVAAALVVAAAAFALGFYMGRRNEVFFVHSHLYIQRPPAEDVDDADKWKWGIQEDET